MNNINKLRKIAKITQKELAKKLNIGESTLSQYESGKREPDYATLKLLANYFNVSIDYLLDYQTKTNKFEMTRQKLTLMLAQRGISVEDLNKLTSDDIAILLSLLEKFIKEKK